tara:strand:- start:118 stop:1029 length:912 start_codon:yes stop_codon:yes gene_type:complete
LNYLKLIENLKKIISVSGPTAVGKTKKAIELAIFLKTEIISFDSRQFYKEMKIGTAPPSKIELSTVKHHFIQNKSIFDNYTVYDYSKDAKNLIDVLFKKYDNIILVGGSFLFLNSIFKELDEMPKISKDLRDRLNQDFEKKGKEYILALLKKIDPKYLEMVDNNNHRRIIRALEVSIQSQKPYSSFLGKKSPSKYNHISIALNNERKVIHDSINKRVDIMMRNGLLEEAQSLYKYSRLNPLNTVGYKELFNYFDGKSSKTESIDQIKINTRRFAKKQITWLNNNGKHFWFSPENNIEKIVKVL